MADCVEFGEFVVGVEERVVDSRGRPGGHDDAFVTELAALRDELIDIAEMVLPAGEIIVIGFAAEGRCAPDLIAACRQFVVVAKIIEVPAVVPVDKDRLFRQELEIFRVFERDIGPEYRSFSQADHDIA